MRVLDQGKDSDRFTTTTSRPLYNVLFGKAPGNGVAGGRSCYQQVDGLFFGNLVKGIGLLLRAEIWQ